MVATKTTSKATKKPAAKKAAAKKAAPAAKKAATKKVAAKKTTAAKKTAAPAKRTAARVSPIRGMPIDEYLATKVTGWVGAMTRRLVELVKETAPDSDVTIKWGQPVFELNGPFAFVKPAKAHVSFGFWRGMHLDDPKNLLGGTGDRMGHLKVTSPDGLDAAALGALVAQAVKLNRQKGDPTKRR